jgi:hypothetical protein
VNSYRPSFQFTSSLLDPRNFLIAADEKDKQPGKGKTEIDGAQPPHSKDTEKKATDPVKGMGEKFLLIKIVFFFLCNTVLSLQVISLPTFQSKFLPLCSG